MAFVDRIVEHPGRFRLTQVDDDVFDLTREEGEVTEAGTPLDAEHFNNEIAYGVISRFVTGTVVKDNVSIATGATSGTLNIDATRAGYTPIAVAGLRITNGSTGGTHGDSCTSFAWYINGNNVAVAVKNNHAQTAVIKVTATVLYIASE